MDRKKVTLKDIMSKPAKTVSKKESVVDAVKKMNKNRFGSLVVTEKGKVMGIITERDILTRIVAKGKNPLKTTVADIMTRKVIAADADDSDVKALYLMTKNKIKRIVVIKRGRLAGIITQTDIIRHLSERWLFQ